MPDNYYSEVNENGVVTPFRDLAAYNGVIANTKLIKDTVGWSGKNKWDKSKTTGIDATITQTSDGFRAQVSNHTWGSARCDFATPEKNKDFILTCKANVATAGNFMKMQVYGSTDGSDYSNSIAVTDTYSATKELELAFNSGNYNYLRITLYLTNGTATSADVTFEKPMLRDASILDPTYEPYFGSTAFPRSEQAVLGARNSLYVPNKTVTDSSIEMVGIDGELSITGQNSGSSAMWVTFSPVSVPKGSFKFKVSGLTANGVTNMQLQTSSGTTVFTVNFEDPEAIGNISANADNYKLFIRIAAGANLSAAKIFPQLLQPSDDSNVNSPYAMTNRELTDKVQGIIDAATNAADFAAFKTAIGNL